jgi:hypothetical protein
MSAPEQSAQATGERAVALINSRDNVVVTGDLWLGADAERDDVLLLAQALGNLRPRCIRRRRPLAPAPRAFEDRVDRDEAVAELAAAIARGESVNLHGDDGVGKSYVLRAVAAAADVVWIDGAGRDVNDVLQGVFEQLFDAHPEIATPERRRGAFADVAAVVVVEDASEAATGADQIRAELGGSVVVLTTRSRVSWGDAAELQVDGLAHDDALELLERRLPGARGDPVASRLVELLRGNPRRIDQAAGLAAKRALPLATLVVALQQDPDGELRKLLLAALDPPDRELVDVLAGAFGATLATERLQALVGVPSPLERLERLEREGVVRSGSPRYRLTIDRYEFDARLAADLVAAPALVDLPAALAILRSSDAPDDVVIALGRAFAPVALYGKRWDAWSLILEHVYRAARRTERPLDTAWALHHIGTREYVIGDEAAAVGALRDALGMRRDRDPGGARATQHNLDFIANPPWFPENDDGGEPPPDPHRGRWVALVAAVLAILVIAFLALSRGNGDDTDNAAQQGTPTATRTATKTATKTATPIMASITAPEAKDYEPDELPPAGFGCTGEPDACTGTLTPPDGNNVDVNDRDPLPADAGDYTLTVTATAGGRTVDSDRVAYTVLPPPLTLTVTIERQADVRRIIGGGISCPGTCTVGVKPNTSVTLSAEALDTETGTWEPTRAAWQPPPCSGSTETCTVDIADTDVTVPVLYIVNPHG